MIIVGLTGGIAMGKTTVAAQFAKLGAGIYNADSAVHRLLKKGGAGVKPVLAEFPEAKAKDGAVDRKKLSDIVFHEPDRLQKLERILHPLVWKEEAAYLKFAKKNRKKIVILDIPLLFETGANARVHKVVVASAPPFIQHQRALQRPHMTPEKLRQILARQLPDKIKRARADFIVETGRGKYDALRQVRRIVKQLLETKTHTPI